MINFEQAHSVAKTYIAEMSAKIGVECVLVDEYTIERPFAWMFFWQSKKYVETSDFRFMAGGNAPIIVDREDGRIHRTGSAHEPESYLEAYAALGPTAYDQGPALRQYFANRRRESS